MNNNYISKIKTIPGYSIIDQIQKEISKNQSNVNEIGHLLKSDKVMGQTNTQDNLSSESEERSIPSFLENSLPDNSEIKYNESNSKQSTQRNRIDYSTLKKKVIDNISEEVITHLKVILDYAEQLKHFPLPLEASKILQGIVDKTNFIMSSLKAQAGLHNGDLELNSQVIYATTVFDDILNLLAGYTESRQINLSRKFDADASIFVDKHMLYQGCLDIVKFLCDCMHNKGEIITVLSRTKDTIILEFQGKGIIISDDFFNNAFQFSDSEKQLTLSYAQSIAMAHKGSIRTGKTIDLAPEIKLELPIIR